MPSRTAPPPLAAAAPVRRGPWWVRAARSAGETVRDLRDLRDPDRAGRREGPDRLRLVLGPDGAPVWETTRDDDRPAAAARAANLAWRHRRTLAPLPVAAGYAALHAVHVDNPRALVVAALTAPLFAASAWLTILGGRDRTRATLTILVLTVTALEAWWLIPAAPPGGVLAVAAAASAASAWRFRIREEAPPPPPDVPWQVARWDELVGRRPIPGVQDAGLLPGSRAHLIRDIYPPDDDADVITGDVAAQSDTPPAARLAPIGFQLAVDLVPGRHEVANVRGKLGLIAGIYAAEKAGMVLDEVGDETRVKLTVTRRKFLVEVKKWRRPTLDVATGRFIWQTLADGSHGHGQLWAPRQGVKHIWIVGATNGGKSGAVDCLFASLLSAAIAVLDLVDLKGGASVPHWRYRALRFGTTLAEGMAALRRGVLLCAYRYDRMARMPAIDKDGAPVILDGEPAQGRTWIDPSPEWPIYTVFVEEWSQLAVHATLGRIAIALAAVIASQGRQALVQIGFTTQPANLDLAFGGNRDLRTNVQAGNVHVLWTDQGTGNLATATRTIDLSRIPQGQPGVGYLVGPAQPRDLQGRVPYVDDPWDAVRAARPGTLGPAELAILAAADAYSASGKVDDARAVALAAFPGDPEWAALVDRILPPDKPLDETATATATAAAAATDVGTGVAWSPGLVLGDQAPPETAAPKRPDGQQAILDRLAAGPATTADLRAALGGVTDQAMRGHLAPLMDDGLVTRTGRGRYALTATIAPADDPDQQED